MAMINIGTDEVANDRSYRYKMPPLKSKIEGRGNGIKTVILNVKEVAQAFKAMKMDPRYVTKFFGVELGAQSKYDPKRDNGVGVVNGSFQTKELQKHLKTFVYEIVLCPNCRYPETTITKCDKKREQIHVECAACGHSGPLPTEHRIVQYFIKHPPATAGKKGGKKKVKMTAKERRALKQKKAREEAKAAASGTTGKKKKRSKGERSSKDVEDVWYCDIPAEALQERMDKETKALEDAKAKASKKSAGTKVKVQDYAKDAPSLILKEFLLLNPSDEDIVGEIERLELARSLQLDQKLKAIFEAIFDMNDSGSIKAAYEKYAGLLRRFTDSESNGHKFIGVFEDVMCRPGLRNYMIPRSAIFFKGLYDLDIISEQSIVSWYNEPAEEALMASKQDAEEIKEAAKPLILWFQKHAAGEAAG